MKNLKKLAALVLSLMMILSLTTSIADEADGTITINGIIGTVNPGDKTPVYEIYKLLDLESYDAAGKNYAYKVNSAWTAFFATDEAKAYFTIDESGYATWSAAEDDATVAAFAKLALAYAQENGIDPVKSSSVEGDFVISEGSGTFSGLELGYYLIDSTVGALCGLTTTNPNASIQAKNERPIIDKTVQEDSTTQWGDSNTADMGQTVNFATTIHVHAGAQNFVLHDKMSEGLTFQKIDKIEYIDPDSSETTNPIVPEADYEVVTTGLTDDCTFEIHFSDSFCDSLQKNDKVVVYYSAMLNRNAVVADAIAEDNGNPNESWLEFGEENYTSHDKTNTYTFGFDLIKTDSQHKLIDGAEFRIYDDATEGNEIAVVPLEIDGEVVEGTYRRARADETGVPIVVKDGKARVVGFDNGTYYLQETKTPAGYNSLSARHKFTISDASLNATFNDDIYSTGSGVHVVNKSGTMLPETGGIGTTLFYVIGGVLVVGAVVLLITKKRMQSMD